MRYTNYITASTINFEVDIRALLFTLCTPRGMPV